MADASKKRTNMRAVADYVDLSPTTVSLALRGDERIPLETRNRVLAAAAALNYHYAPRPRRSGKNDLRQIVYMVHDYGDRTVAANPFYGQILGSIEEQCRDWAANLSLVVLQQDHTPARPLPIQVQGEPDGILMASGYPRALVDRVAAAGNCPLVLIDNSFPAATVDSVMVDDYGGGYLVTRHLLELGHKTILPIASFTRNVQLPPSFRERYRGYCFACEEAGIVPEPLQLVPNEIRSPLESQRSEYQSWLSTLVKRETPPTAIFALADHLAVVVLLSLQALGYQVPQDVAVAGFDDADMASLVNPPLTTYHSYKREIGRIAVERLMARIDGDVSPPLHITIGGHLVVRASTCAGRA